MNKLFFALVLFFPFIISSVQAQTQLPGPYKPFSHQDGDFSAELFVISKNDLKEFEKPSDQGVHLKMIGKAKRGEAIVIKVGFSGMDLDKDMMSDVTYDLKILNPKGKVMGEPLHNLEAIKTKVERENRFYIFDSQAFIEIVFDATDEMGTYKFIAEIRDNIGKKRIPLETTIELAE